MQLDPGPGKAEVPTVQDQSEQNPPEQDQPEPNPFERILLIVGAVLVVGGVAAAFWANSVNYYPGTIGNPWTWQQLLQSAAWSVSGPMSTAGLAMGVGVLFRRAMSWKPSE